MFDECLLYKDVTHCFSDILILETVNSAEKELQICNAFKINKDIKVYVRAVKFRLRRAFPSFT